MGGLASDTPFRCRPNEAYDEDATSPPMRTTGSGPQLRNEAAYSILARPGSNRASTSPHPHELPLLGSCPRVFLSNLNVADDLLGSIQQTQLQRPASASAIDIFSTE
jgi:hypothetical protein